MIFGGVSIAIALFIPETYAPVLLQNKVSSEYWDLQSMLIRIWFQAKRLRKADPERNANLYAQHEKEDWSWRGVIDRTIYRPFKMLFLEPILVLTTLYLSMVYGLLYGCRGSFLILPRS